MAEVLLETVQRDDKPVGVAALTWSDLCRSEMIAESYVPSTEIRELRSFAWDRKRLVEKRTDFKNEYYPRSEWSVFSTTHNILKLFRSGWTPDRAVGATTITG